MLDVTCEVKNSGPIVPLARTRGSPVTYLCSDFGSFPSSFASSTSAYWAPGAAAAASSELRTSFAAVRVGPVCFVVAGKQPVASSDSDNPVTATAPPGQLFGDM